MRVVVVGGYGVFGGRLARLLARDGHEVVVAGRNEEMAARMAAEIGGEPLRLDLSGDLSPLARSRPGAVVDCAGPFQSYGDDPYRLARAAIGCSSHYLDLSDDAAFTRGVATLDGEARAAGVFALSGASSAPGLSSVVAAHLADGLTDVDLVETAILPGNRAPRGEAVVSSILGQVGAPIAMTRDGREVAVSGWTEPRTYNLGEGVRRRGWLIGVPDLDLFPHRFGARSVVFRAGLELPLMNLGLASLGWLRRVGLLSDARRLMRPLLWAARALEPLGEDRGGMTVAVVGRDASGVRVRRRWRLRAEAGEGPFVPGVVARAILRRPEAVDPGARPCLSELALTEVDAALADLAATTETEERPAENLFSTAIGAEWRALPEVVRRGHEAADVVHLAGRASVRRGGHRLARMVARIFGFPPASEDTAVSVEMRRTDRGEIWTRRFGGEDARSFVSHLTPSEPGHVRERFGPMTFDLHLIVRSGALEFHVRRGWILGVPMPRFLLPASEARETESEGRFHFDVGLYAPLGIGLIVRYRGWLRRCGDVEVASPRS